MAKEFFVVEKNGKLEMVLETAQKMFSSLNEKPTEILIILRSEKLKQKTIKVLNSPEFQQA